MKKCELLSPAGDIERLKWAIKYGADAIYIGGKKLSLRANASNFDINEIKEACTLAHKNNVLVYVTLNIIFHDSDFEELKGYLKDLEKCGVDALIVADLSLLDIISEVTPNMEIHISTQSSTLNYMAVKFLKKYNVTRVVLGREASKEDIIKIKEETGLEIEVFIHGAMCSGYSGRCVLSNFFTLRDANRGGCAQVCRFAFDIYDKDDNKINIDNKYSIAAKDLIMADYIKDMIEIGVSSLKIEGRMRSNFYIASVLHNYRRIIDHYTNGTSADIDYHIETLKKCSNRESTPQFFHKEIDGDASYYVGRVELTNQDFIAVVLSYDEDTKEAIISQRNHFKLDDTLCVFGPNTNDLEFRVEYIKNEDDEFIDKGCHPMETLKINMPFKVYKDDIIKRK